ncbi:MAG: helix-turn-helix domain-containing protein [Clostridia bacterium]|nr:helix-turn-helix domain-containing protein [Clostridia bacterium]
MEEFRRRLVAVMEELNITQSELCARTGIPKSAMSQYLSGSFKPRQNRTYLIARALNVSPAWLMGYDVLRDAELTREDALPRENLLPREVDEHDLFPLSEAEQRLIAAYRASPALRSAVDSLLAEGFGHKKTQVFRAAHSGDGSVPPASVSLPEERLKALRDAPETDEDF